MRKGTGRKRIKNNRNKGKPPSAFEESFPDTMRKNDTGLFRITPTVANKRHAQEGDKQYREIVGRRTV